MNRRTKIIVSVAGIFIVLLALLRLTYAYFLTRINGNTNDKSISVSTANLELTYEDGNGAITGTNIMPGTELNPKTFSVENKGEDTSYIVVLEDVIIKDSSNNTTTFESNDFTYTLTCTSNCNGVTDEVLPLSNGILVSNDIKKGVTQNYTLTITYNETGKDQSNDMGKTIQAKINIIDPNKENPYRNNKESLAYNVINNAIINKNGTELRATPLSIPAQEISTKWGTGKAIEQELDMSTQSQWYYGTTYDDAQPWNGGSSTSYVSECSDTIIGKYISCPVASESWLVKSCKSSTVAIYEAEEILPEKILSIARDDYGTSYYYRGEVTDNYVTLNNMCWRIVRIEGDGSVKLVLEDQDEECSSTMDGNWDIPTTTAGTTKTGNFGYTYYEANTLTASDGTKNSNYRYIMNYLNGGTKNDSSMATAFKNFQLSSKISEITNKLKSGNWCMNDKAYAADNDNTTPLTSTEILDKQVKGTSYYYDSRVRLSGKTPKEPTLKCNGTKMNKFGDNTDMYVGTLTADEIVYAGGKVDTNNPDYYLINDYQKSNRLSFWSLAPGVLFSSGNSAYRVEYNGELRSLMVFYNFSLRPVISLATGAEIASGDGTIGNPYMIKMD